ncbi:winged helix-turn-helix domain-containing protein [Edaphobacter sp. HDX4]|uniref:winged helix-turn-helix domain-containing protein n=1 Tax=Edaphobacter sp. HDX4 TaxID=2794064 RepID=UPI002FE57C1E
MSLQQQSRPSALIWTFGNCEFDELRLQLRVDGRLVEVETKPLEVLRQLLLDAGQVVTKQRLLDSVWPGVMVVDGSIATAVSKLRKALNDEDARIVLTVARVGYRLGVPVDSRPATAERPSTHEGKQDEDHGIAPSTVESPTLASPASVLDRMWRLRFVAAGIAVLCVLAFALSRQRSFLPKTDEGSVAVLPLQNAGSDPSLDFLSIALADEVATELSNVGSLSVRPATTTSKTLVAEADLVSAGRRLHVSSVVTGHFIKEGQLLHVSVEAIKVDDGRLLWRNTLTAPAGDMLAMRDEILMKIRGELATALGAPATAPRAESRPTNNEAYTLYLQSLSLPYDPEPSQRASRMLERSVELDRSFAPAWLMLSRRYYVESRYASGKSKTMDRFEAALERSRSLDPNYLPASAGLVALHTERGELTKALHEAQDLMRRRPDSADAHYSLSYVLRYAGLLDKAATQCDIAFLLEPHTQSSGLRSCAVVFLLAGDYSRAMDFVRLDSEGSNWRKALSIHILLREGKIEEAVRLGPAGIPQWQSFDMLLACAEHRPSAEIDKVADRLVPADDPETKYFAASHLAYCGKLNASLELLRQAVRGGYCSYPAVDLDPFFAGLRGTRDFAQIHTSSKKCQANFLLEINSNKTATPPAYPTP